MLAQCPKVIQQISNTNLERGLKQHHHDDGNTFAYLTKIFTLSTCVFLILFFHIFVHSAVVLVQSAT